MEQFRQGLGDAWGAVATFLPKLIGFLLILAIGYFIAKAISKVLDKILEKVGFDKLVERGGVGKALDKSRFDASDILGKIVFWVPFCSCCSLLLVSLGPTRSAISSRVSSPTCRTCSSPSS